MVSPQSCTFFVITIAYIAIHSVIGLKYPKPEAIRYSIRNGLKRPLFEGYTTIESRSISIFCGQGQPTSISKALPAFKSCVNVNSVSVNFCCLPKSTFIDEFEALNLNLTNLESLHVIFAEKDPIPPGNYTVDLNISALILENWETKEPIELLRDVQNFFGPLSNLTFLELHHIHMQRIPENIHLKELVLANNASLHDWGNCEFLEKLQIQSNEQNMPRWPKTCTRLVDLSIKGMRSNLTQKIVNMTHAAPHLINLTLTSNSLTSLPKLFFEATKQIQNLNLSDNYLYDNAFFRTFPYMAYFKSLDVSKTLVRGTFLKLLPWLGWIHHLYMNNNVNLDCSRSLTWKNDILPYLKQSYLEVITLRGTNLSISCLTHNSAKYRNLSYLDLSSTRSQVLFLRDLPTSGAKTLTIKFNDKKAFKDIYFHEGDYKVFKVKNALLQNDTRINQLKVLTTTVDCDCKTGWLARALHDFPDLLSMPGLRCQHNGVSVLQESPETMECVKKVDESTGCIFRQVWNSVIVDAECKTGIIPKKVFLRGFNVSGSNLTDFFTELPQTVQWIDYRNNHLSKAADHAVVDTMFWNGRRVWLGQNEIICDCDNRMLIEAIQEHYKQIEDYDQLTCIGTGRLIREVSTAKLCQTALKISMSSLGVLAGLMLILALIYGRNREGINMFLYSRGWCLMCLHKEEFDDRHYDAFISYAHGDDRYVREVLVPRLENSVENFRICIHYRDWVVGGWIPAQIMHSVSHSKRTIIVLSSNFIASEWSTLEFRYALTKISDKDSPRVLILVLDDVLETGNMGPELQSYLKFNTYLRCDDPWFWQKLRYAMPHRGNIKRTPKRNDEEILQNMMNMGPLGGTRHQQDEVLHDDH